MLFFLCLAIYCYLFVMSCLYISSSFSHVCDDVFLSVVGYLLLPLVHEMFIFLLISN